MHRSSSSLLLIAALLLLPAIASAQEEEPTTFVYATYFNCDASKQDRVDFAVKNGFAPVFDAAVEAGTISSWGWLAHHTGGQWRRLLYYTAPGLDALLDVPDAVYGKIEETQPSANRVVNEVCSSHDDYIWKAGPSSRGAGLIPQERGKVGISVYFYCTMSKEERADEIVEQSFAPIYNRHVEEGNISSWGWLKHDFGGKWRRISTMTGPDVKSLLAARSAILAEVSEQAEAAGNEFGEICGSHQDYLWNIVHETP